MNSKLQMTSAALEIWRIRVWNLFRIADLGLRISRLTPSQQFFLVCVAFIGGIVLGTYVPISVVVLYFAVWVLFSLGLWTCWPAPERWAWFLVAGAVLMGLVRVEMVVAKSRVGLAALPLHREIVVRGDVVGSVVPQLRTVRFQLQLEDIVNTPIDVRGQRVSVVARPYPEVTRGDRLELACTLTASHRGSAGSVDCLFPRVVSIGESSRTSMTQALTTLKTWYVYSLERVFPEPEAGFITGLLVGGRSSLGPEWRTALAASGTTHLVALSGFNVAIIASFLVLLLRQLSIPRRWHTVLIGMTIGAFVVAVGAEASIVRAALMGLVVVLGRGLGRTASIRNAIALTAVAMLAVDPTILTGSLSFQLSFLATLGVVYLYPLFERWTKPLSNPLGLKEALLMALAAELFVTPLLLYSFGRFSLVSPFVNMLVVPLVPFTMLFGFLGGLGGLLTVPLGQALGFSGWLLAKAILFIIRSAAGLSFAATELHLSAWMVAAYYICLVSALVRYYLLQEREGTPNTKLL